MCSSCGRQASLWLGHLGSLLLMPGVYKSPLLIHHPSQQEGIWCQHLLILLARCACLPSGGRRGSVLLHSLISHIVGAVASCGSHYLTLGSLQLGLGWLPFQSCLLE